MMLLQLPLCVHVVEIVYTCLLTGENQLSEREEERKLLEAKVARLRQLTGVWNLIFGCWLADE
jgi:hypothetical protein